MEKTMQNAMQDYRVIHREIMVQYQAMPTLEDTAVNSVLALRFRTARCFVLCLLPQCLHVVNVSFYHLAATSKDFCLSTCQFACLARHLPVCLSVPICNVSSGGPISGATQDPYKSASDSSIS